ncbi:MAG: SDR family oxidoreductase [Pirellulaceae bacterium]|nr:SDR family oxidoreductase [Pirellulaceae bacterium]
MTSSSNHYIVFGASGGIGSEVCRRLHAAGDRVTLAGRNAESLTQLADALQSPVNVVDATSIEAVDRAVAEATEAAGRLDGVVNCVGSILLKPAHLTTDREWHDTLAANLTSAFAAVRAGCAAMKQQGGAIVLVSSAAAQIGLPNHEAIAAAKAGVIGLARSAAATYAARGIRVNVVSPGLVQTPLTERIWKNERSAEASRAMHAAGRLGKPEDVASLIVWLLQPENDWVTGQVYGVDGGLATVRAMGR